MEMGSLLQNKFPSSSFQGPQPRAAFGQREGIQQAWLPRPTCFETVGNKFSLKSFTAENEGKRCWGGDGDKHAPAPLESATTAKPGSQLGEAGSWDGNWDRRLPCSHNKPGMSWQPGTFVPCGDSGWLQDSVSRRFPRHRTRAVHAQRTPHHTRLPLGAKVSSRSFPARRSAGSGAGVACVSTRAESRQRLQTPGSTATAVPAPPRTDVPKCKCTCTPGTDVPKRHLAMQSHLLPPQILSPCRSTSAPVPSKLPAGHTLPLGLLEAIVTQPRAAPTARAGARGAPPGDAAASIWQLQPHAGAGQWGRSQPVLTKPIPVQRGRAPGSCIWGCARTGGTGARVPMPGGVSTRRGAAAKARTD